ncbi:FecR domain-containing protein [Paraburkholderia sp. BCC1886]|uniref:FecR domain-containing protein n=1 Tax=Paraburkholderia sp. BCC1886 TaxID=2562670 RepID=UPI00118356D0|nr:FecR domain-containing protein [Paraburkholderia sp. BCC1886]
MNATTRIDATIVAQAADWVVKLQTAPSARHRAAFERWRASSPLHEEAWRRMADMMQGLDDNVAQLAPNTVRPIVERVATRQQKRRRTIARLLAIPGAGVVGWSLVDVAPWRGWTAGYRTAAGERREFVLADNTRLTLNTNTAADVRFDAQQRRITLYSGEILVVSGHDPAGRPLHVATRNGVITPIGTRFVVRQPDETGGDTQVGVLEGAVEIRPDNAAGRVLTLTHGQTASFNRSEYVEPTALDTSTTAWLDGLLVARNMRLADLIAELARYRRGILRCDPTVGALRVTGIFSVQDTDKALRLLENILPVSVQSRTRYWVTVTQR